MFELFTKTDNKTKKVENNKGEVNAINFGNNNSLLSTSAVKVFFPQSYDDVSTMIDTLTSGNAIIVNLTCVREDTAQRVLDLLCGATYALKGGLEKIEKNIYLFSIQGVSTM